MGNEDSTFGAPETDTNQDKSRHLGQAAKADDGFREPAYTSSPPALETVERSFSRNIINGWDNPTGSFLKNGGNIEKARTLSLSLQEATYRGPNTNG